MRPVDPYPSSPYNVLSPVSIVVFVIYKDGNKTYDRTK